VSVPVIMVRHIGKLYWC